MAIDRRHIAEEIAAVLAEHRVHVSATANGGVRLSVTPHEQVAAALLPLIDRVKAEAAADALAALSDELQTLRARAVDKPAHPYVTGYRDALSLARRRIRQRVGAAALRTAPTATDAQEASTDGR